jgi:glycosyltransferase involved in cell wall biosynthesis
MAILTPRIDGMNTAPCRVSVVIKALNEEEKICAAIESALRAVDEVGGEVVLADSCSSDRTVELASGYPIRIVQLANPDERSCGIGPQLGFQHSQGEYVYLMDGDMEMLPGILPHALNFLAQHPEVAGVSGRVVELNKESLEYRERDLRAPAHLSPGQVDRLDGGGLYRRLAIQESGYLSDRNLHSYEEFDLAVRLRALGWNLYRLPIDAVTHEGHHTPPYRLMLRRWRTRYACGMGELVRAAAGRPQMRLVLRNLRELRIYSAVVAWWCLLLGVALWPAPAVPRMAVFALLALLPLLVMIWRKRSLARGLYSVVSWCFNAAGLVRGLLHRRLPPGDPIDSRVLREPPPALEPRRKFYA